MHRKKHSFTLLEILIAFSLASILFTCIFSNFAQMSKLQVQLEKAHALAIKRQGFDLYLRSLFARLPAAIEPAEKSEDFVSPLYIADLNGAKGTGALWFSLTVDYDSDTRFIGPLDFCLYCDEKNHALKLLTRNAQGNEKVEELMPSVKSWKISLFDPEKGTWVHNWPKNTDYLPPLLKLQILELDKKKGRAVDFAFALPVSREALVFEAP